MIIYSNHSAKKHLSIKKDKIISFRTDEEHHKKLNEVVYDKNMAKKEWIEESIAQADAENILSLNENEKWVKIPTKEYSRLLESQWLSHAKYICDRIEDHIKSKNIQVNFDNLFFETNLFHNMNKIKMVRFEDGDLEIIHLIHDFGEGFGKFETQLIIEMLTRTSDYKLISKESDEEKLTLKIKKC